MVPLKEILTPVSRPENVNPQDTYRILGAHWYAKGLYIKDVRTGSQIQAKHLFRVEQGDFVYNRLFAWKGSFAVATEDNHGCYVSNEFLCFTINKNIAEVDYLFKYFSRASIWDEALSLSSGGTPTSRNRLKEEKFLSMQIPLPPLSEQQRIVAKIEELAAKVEEARGFRQQMIKGTEALWHASLKSIISKGLMDRWDMKPISEVAEISPSKQDISVYSNDMQVSFVPMSALDDLTGRIVKPETRQIGEVKKGYTYFANGDVIFARITPCMQNGKSAIARDLINGIGFGSTEFHVMRPKTNLLAEWLHVIVRHKDFKDDATAHFKGTAGQQRVPQSFLEKKLIPIPPIPEQLRIVSYLDNLQSKVDELKRFQNETQKELDALMPSILDKAFKGEL